MNAERIIARRVALCESRFEHIWYKNPWGDRDNLVCPRCGIRQELSCDERNDMKTARVLLEVTAGVMPDTPEPELTKQWAITSEEWNEKGANQGYILATVNGKAQGYAGWLMMQPDRVNWVRTDWIWL